MDKNIYIQDLQRRITLYEDAVAYKQLFLYLFPSLYNFSNAIVKSKVLAEEIVSDIFMDIWKRRLTLNNIENLRLYMFIAVRNHSVKIKKQEGNQTHLSIENIAIDFISDYGCPDEKLLKGEMEQQIKNAVKALPPKCQLIYKLAKEDNLKYREIAELLHISIKTVDNQLGIAFKKIALSVGFHLAKKNK